jgi:Multicopper oxidase
LRTVYCAAYPANQRTRENAVERVRKSPPSRRGVDVRALGLEGVRWSAQILPLLRSPAYSPQFSVTHPGLWLFHRHVVDHADVGMIGIFDITAE